VELETLVVPIEDAAWCIEGSGGGVGTTKKETVNGIKEDAVFFLFFFSAGKYVRSVQGLCHRLRRFPAHGRQARPG
jgi:hypothetical protein